MKMKEIVPEYSLGVSVHGKNGCIPLCFGLLCEYMSIFASTSNPFMP